MGIKRYLQLSKFHAAGDKDLFSILEKTLKDAGYQVFNDSSVFTFYPSEDSIHDNSEVKVETQKNEEIVNEPVKKEENEKPNSIKMDIMKFLYDNNAKTRNTAVSYIIDEEKLTLEKLMENVQDLVNDGFVQTVDNGKMFLTELGIYEYNLNIPEGA
jgi:hypothetical protein